MATGKTNKAAQTYTGPGTYYNTKDLIPVNYQITILWCEGNWYHIGYGKVKNCSEREHPKY